METCRINPKDLIICTILQIDEATVEFLVYEEQKEIMGRSYEDCQEYIPEEIELVKVVPTKVTFLDNSVPSSCVTTNPTNVLYLLTDEQIEDIIDAVYELKEN